MAILRRGRLELLTRAGTDEEVLARRGERIALALRQSGHEPLEVDPFATLRLLRLPWRGKKTAGGRRRIGRALRPMVPGLRHPRASEHPLDAVVRALTAQLWRDRKTRDVGLPEEGLMTVPDVARAPQPISTGRPRPPRRPTGSRGR